MRYILPLITIAALTGCASMNFGWYKPGVSQQEFAQDKFACMNGSQMQVSTSNVNGTGSTYYGGGDVTCNTYGSTTNCSGGGGYSQPGYVSGSSASYTTTNQPLFQACMQARGYLWTNQAAVEKYEAAQQPQTYAGPASPVVSQETASKRAYCFAHPTVCDPDKLTAEDVSRSKAAAASAQGLQQNAAPAAQLNAQQDARIDHQMRLDRLQRSLACQKSHRYQECPDARAAGDDVTSGRISQDEWWQVLKQVEQVPMASH